VATLVAPSGTNYVLARRVGGAFDDLILDTNVAIGAGEWAAGEWQLLVQDRAARDTGALNSFELNITPSCQ
jgi:subtilisin-like proprotein convertase family protein